MKTFISILFYLLISIKSDAQNIEENLKYPLFPVNNSSISSMHKTAFLFDKIWYSYQIGFEPSRGCIFKKRFAEYDDSLHPYVYTIYIDTPFNGGPRGAAILRFDSLENKIYQYNPYPQDLSKRETLLYNFSINVGDSVNYNTNIGDTTLLICKSKNLVLLKNSKMANQFIFKKSRGLDSLDVIWLEGIGNLLNPFLPYGSTNKNHQFCASDSTGILHFNDSTICNLFDPSLGVLEKNEIVNLDIYPNPFDKGLLNLKSEKSFEFIIYNIQGISVFYSEKKNQEHRVGLELSSGIYMVQLKFDQKICTRKLVIL